MKKPSDVTKLVLKKSKKYIIFRVFVSVVYRAIAMIIPILLSTAINHATHGDYDKAISISIISIVVVIIFRIFDILATYAWHKLYNCIHFLFLAFYLIRLYVDIPNNHHKTQSNIRC